MWNIRIKTVNDPVEIWEDLGKDLGIREIWGKFFGMIGKVEEKFEQDSMQIHLILNVKDNL